MEDTSCVVEKISNHTNGLNLNNFCPLRPVEPGCRVVPSDIALVITREDRSYVNTCVNGASFNQPCGRMSLENVRAATNAITDSQMESEDAPTLVGHTTDSDLRMSGWRTALFDLNQIPESETSELALVSDGFINDELKASVDEVEPQIVSAKFLEPVASAVVSDTTHRFNRRPSPETETSESPICKDAAVPDGNATGKQRNPKYRSLADLLSVEGDGTKRVPSKGGFEVSSCSANDNKSKKKKRKIQEKQIPRCSTSRDAPEGKIRSRTGHSSLLKDNGRLHCDVKVQPSLVPCGKRTERKSVVPDASSKISIPTQSKRHKTSTLNEAENMLLPQKRRIFCNDFLGTNANTGKSRLPGPNAFLTKSDRNYIGRKRVKLSSCKKMKQASASEDSCQELFGAEHPPPVLEQRPATDTRMEVMMQLALRDRYPSSLLLSLHGEGALSGMQMLSRVAAETAAPSHPTSFSKFGVLDLGYSGCIEARAPSEFALMGQDWDLFKLGPEDLPLRSRNKYMPQTGQETEESKKKQ